LMLLLATIAQLLLEISSEATFSPSIIEAEFEAGAAITTLLERMRAVRMTLLNMVGSDK